MLRIVDGNNFHIIPQGRVGLKYVEGDLEVYVDGEMGLGDPDFIVYSNCVHEWGNESRLLPESERTRILRNIETAFQEQGLKVEFL